MLAFILLLSMLQPAPPTLSMFTVNNFGRVDLLRGDTMQVVIELRGGATAPATAQQLIPEGLEAVGMTASNGAVSPAPFPSWKGEVGEDQPVNIVITYRVSAAAVPGDRIVEAFAQVGARSLRASTTLRVCCVPAAPALGGPARLYMPVFRA